MQKRFLRHGRKKEPILIDIKEASELLGIPVWTLRKLVKDRKIPYVRVNRRIMFNKEKLLKWIEQHSFEPTDD